MRCWKRSRGSLRAHARRWRRRARFPEEVQSALSGPGGFYTALNQSLETAPRVAVATIVRTRGSSPREVGARMLVRPDGATDGTLGGGCREAGVWRAALEVRQEDQQRVGGVHLAHERSM